MDIKNRDDYAVTTQPYILGSISQTSLDKYIAQFKNFVKEFIKNKILYSKKSSSEPTSYSERYGSELQTEGQVERVQV